MKQLINRLYGITQQGEIFEMIVQNLYNDIAADQWNVWNCTGEWGILENYSVESDRGDKSGVNEIADQ